MMKWITIGLLSLLFTLFDYKIGLEEILLIYGFSTYKLIITFPLNVIYATLIFIIEFLILWTAYNRLLYIYRKRKLLKFICRIPK